MWAGWKSKVNSMDETTWSSHLPGSMEGVRNAGSEIRNLINEMSYQEAVLRSKLRTGNLHEGEGSKRVRQQLGAMDWVRKKLNMQTNVRD